MKLKDLLPIIGAGTVQIYEEDLQSETGFHDIYSSPPQKITGDILNWNVVTIGAARKYVIDVQVSKNKN